MPILTPMLDQTVQFRPDYRATQRHFKDRRSAERIKAHYLLEKGLACRLRGAPPADRARVYQEVYEELFRSLPDHPQRRADRAMRGRHVARLLALLMPFLGRDKAFLEVGCGDANLSSAVARHVAHSYALDVTDALIERAELPENLDVLVTTGAEIPLPERSIDVAVSDQLMEHLHPEDARAQLSEVFRVLKAGGIYYCITPNRLTGPHDISSAFDYEATGFHLQEYDSSMLSSLLKMAGFRRVRFVVAFGSYKLGIASPIVSFLEKALEAAPPLLRAWAARRRAIQMLAGLNVLATK